VQQLHAPSEEQSETKYGHFKNDPSQMIGSRLPVKSIMSDQTEWQGNGSKRDIHMNKTNQSTYRATGLHYAEKQLKVLYDK
jgi:hypothetical protein